MPPLSVTVESVVAPSLNVTVPVGVPPPVAVTVAVKVTDCPNTLGFAEAANPVAVFALTTVWESVEEVLVLKLVLPL